MAMVEKMQRDLTKEARWRSLLKRQAASGQTIAEWCRRHHIADSLFHYWKRAIADRDRRSTGPAGEVVAKGQGGVGFAQVRVTPSAESPMRAVTGVEPAVEIVLADSRVVRVGAGFDPLTLARVLAVLEGRPC
jgi:transposase-like protein